MIDHNKKGRCYEHLPYHKLASHFLPDLVFSQIAIPAAITKQPEKSIIIKSIFYLFKMILAILAKDIVKKHPIIALYISIE